MVGDKSKNGDGELNEIYGLNELCPFPALSFAHTSLGDPYCNQSKLGTGPKSN
jgi:hypothetical protein